MENINARAKGLIANYIFVNLSKKGISKSEFAAKLGVHPSAISNIARESAYKKVGESFWRFAWKMYEQQSFDKVLSGELRYKEQKEELVRTKPKVVEKTTLPLPEDVSHTSAHLIVTPKALSPGDVREKISVGEAIQALIDSGFKLSITLNTQE